MLTSDEIRMGDVVRLRNGETVEVDSIATMIHDRDGEHEGPFVIAKGQLRDRYLLADVLEIAERNERLCAICGGGVTSPEPEVDYCRMCYYSGAAEERVRAAQIDRFREIPEATFVGIEHTGGGCFWFSVRFGEGEDYYVLTDGEASLPARRVEVENGETTWESIPDGGWRYLGLHSDDEDSPHFEGTPLREDSDEAPGFSDADAIRDIGRHRRGQRPFPQRGTCRINANTRGDRDYAGATSYKLTVPAALAREIGPDALFGVEVTEDGLLYRFIQGETGVPRPGWLR